MKILNQKKELLNSIALSFQSTIKKADDDARILINYYRKFVRIVSVGCCVTYEVDLNGNTLRVITKSHNEEFNFSNSKKLVDELLELMNCTYKFKLYGGAFK